METFLSAALAFAVAAFFVMLELITSDYPRTFFVLSKEKLLYIYAAIYGIIALVVTLIFTSLVNAEAIQLEGLGLSSPYVRAIALGMSVKALLHINLFTVQVGSQSTPIGLETIVQSFEPAMLRTIYLSEFEGLRAYVGPYTAKYPDLDDARQKTIDSIPPKLPKEEKAAFEKDVDDAKNTIELFELIVRTLGKRTLNRLFPL